MKVTKKVSFFPVVNVSLKYCASPVYFQSMLPLESRKQQRLLVNAMGKAHTPLLSR